MSNNYDHMSKEELVEIVDQQSYTIKNLKAALDNFTKKFNEAQSLANIGLWEWDIPNNNVIWSDQVYRLFDIELNTKVTYDIILDKIHPDDREYHNKLTEEWIKNRGGAPYIYRIIVNDGSVKYVQAFGKVECDDDGVPTRFIGAIQDTTEQYILQHKLEEALTKALEGFLPICSYCKAVRNKKNEWGSLEKYISQHSKAQVTHSVCPDCAAMVLKRLDQGEYD